MITNDTNSNQFGLSTQNEVINKEKCDKEISKLFQNARNVLEELDPNVKRDKKQTVIELAKNLEELIQIGTISIEIVNQLRRQASVCFIRQCLDGKYKQRIRIENARNQKRLSQLNTNEDFVIRLHCATVNNLYKFENSDID